MTAHPSAVHPTDALALGQLYSTQQVADALGVHQSTVQHWIRTGQLTAVRYGKVLRVRQADLAAFGVVTGQAAVTTATAEE